ncbi:MAG: sensor histidine kinase, partial [Xanthomonadales bacterium]|nr:sensor histidine kinase [Xanthomonadales bacterium]MCB1576878.1 sensor histidine kinase [Xanthomonadales bacterium]
LAMVVREATTNIQRHARARRARVALEADKGIARLSISDDGNGNAIVAGNGLRGMRERVEAIGGSIVIDSERGRGTCIAVELPLDIAAPGEQSAGARPSLAGS